MSVSRKIVLALVVLATLVLAADAMACTVCYGDSDEPMVKAAKQAILFMAGMTYTLLTGGVAVFIVLRRRVRRRLDADAATTPADKGAS